MLLLTLTPTSHLSLTRSLAGKIRRRISHAAYGIRQGFRIVAILTVIAIPEAGAQQEAWSLGKSSRNPVLTGLLCLRNYRRPGDFVARWPLGHTQINVKEIGPVCFFREFEFSIVLHIGRNFSPGEVYRDAV